MEIEAKFTVPDRATFDRLLALRAVGGCLLREAGVEHITDHYLDTPGRAVEQGGYALRLREAAGRPEWLATLKSLGSAQGAVHTREEHEAAVPALALPPAWPPSPARDLALRLAGGEPLSELFDLEQTRCRRAVVAPTGERRVAALSLDMVTLSSPAGEAVTYELELELGPDGRREELDALAAELASYGLSPQPLSKFARALAVLDTGRLPALPPSGRAGPGVLPDDPMAEAGRKVLAFHFARMLAQEDGVRAGLEMRPVHAMRVAARRQRAALRLLRGFFKPGRLRRLRTGLRALAARLGAVRDLDVQLEAARAYQAGLSPQAAAEFEPVLAAWQAERDAARAALLAHLDSPRYTKFKQRYAEFLAVPGVGVPRAAAGPEAAPVRLRHVLPARLWEAYSAVRAYETSLPDAPLETLHALRIAGKRLRYALEFAAEALDPAVADLIEAVTAMQDHLGALNDLDVAVARLLALEASPAAAALRRPVRAYLADCRARLSSQRRTLGPVWRGVNSPKFRKRLGRVTSRL